MDRLTRAGTVPNAVLMRLTAALTPLAAPVLGIPVALADALPTWALLTLLGVSALLAAAQVTVTQVIRLRASARISRSDHALRALEIEDLPQQRRRTRPLHQNRHSESRHILMRQSRF